VSEEKSIWEGPTGGGHTKLRVIVVIAKVKKGGGGKRLKKAREGSRVSVLPPKTPTLFDRLVCLQGIATGLEFTDDRQTGEIFVLLQHHDGMNHWTENGCPPPL